MVLGGVGCAAAVTRWDALHLLRDIMSVETMAVVDTEERTAGVLSKGVDDTRGVLQNNP